MSDTYTQEQLEEIFAKRLVEQARRERVDIIEKGFAALSAKVDKSNNLKQDIVGRLDVQDEAIAYLKGVLDSVQIGAMTPEERAALLLMVKKFVLDGEIRMAASKMWTRVMAGSAILGPAIAVLISKVIH